MSAPHTNIEKQQRRHIGPLMGMAFAVLVVVALGIWWATADQRETTPVDPAVSSALPENG